MNPTPPDVFILGLGCLGLPLAQKLYENGSRVAALKRTFTSDDINLPIDLDIIDIGQKDSFQTTLHHHTGKPTWIFLLPPSALPNYADTVRLWAQCAEQTGIKHLIFTSSTSIYGDTPRECTEHTPPDPQTESARKILAAEQYLLDSRVPHIDILRLGGLYCAERHPVSRLVQKPNIPDGGKPVNIIHRDLAVQALFQTTLHPAGRRIRNIVEPRHPARRDFYTAEAAKLGLPPPDFATDNSSSGKIVNTVSAEGLSL